MCLCIPSIGVMYVISIHMNYGKSDQPKAKIER